MSGTETLTGTVTGAAAAKLLNSNSNAGPAFPSLVFTGPVSTTIKGPVGLGGGNAKTATHTFVTPAGNFTVQHTAKTNGQAQPTVTGKSGSTCYFTQNGGTGDLYGARVQEHREVRGRDRQRHLRHYDPR